MRTLFVTVRANFRMFEVVPFSHSSSVYIPSTRLPSCLLVMIGEANSFVSNTVLMVGLLGPLDIVPERAGSVDPEFFGVLEVELVGL